MRGSTASTTDSDILGALLAHGAADSSLEQAALDSCRPSAARSV